MGLGVAGYPSKRRAKVSAPVSSHALDVLVSEPEDSAARAEGGLGEVSRRDCPA